MKTIYLSLVLIAIVSSASFAQSGFIEGVVTDSSGVGVRALIESLNTFGGAGVVQIPELQRLLKHICRNGFEHHVAGTFSHVADAVHEATSRYLGWDVLRHG